MEYFSKKLLNHKNKEIKRIRLINELWKWRCSMRLDKPSIFSLFCYRSKYSRFRWASTVPGTASFWKRLFVLVRHRGRAFGSLWFQILKDIVLIVVVVIRNTTFTCIPVFFFFFFWSIPLWVRLLNIRMDSDHSVNPILIRFSISYRLAIFLTIKGTIEQRNVRLFD